MSLKRTSVKLLSWLYPYEDQQKELVSPELAISEVSLLLPEISGGGQRSLVSLLEKQQYVVRYRSQGASYLQITSHGREALEAQFPVFRFLHEPWNGTWSLIAFLEAPKNDPQFRYLRSRLIQERAAQFKPGLYLYPGKLNAELSVLLKRMYVGALVVWQSDEWQFGDERHIVSEIFGFSDLLSALSGASKEIDELLSKISDEKRLTEKGKEIKSSIFKVLNRLVEVMEQDLGIATFYFPQVESMKKILYRLHWAYKEVER